MEAMNCACVKYFSEDVYLASHNLWWSYRSQHYTKMWAHNYPSHLEYVLFKFSADWYHVV